MIDFASFLKTGIQNKNLISAIVEATHPCKFLLWDDIIIFSLNGELGCKFIG